MKNHIYHSFIINAPTSTIFEAVTKPTQLINWWPLACSGKPEMKAEYNFNFTDTYNWYGKVVHFEQNKSFHIKMTESSEDWSPTTFGFDLESINENKTQVHFSHINWPNCNAEFKQSSYCWAILLHDLKNYIEKGLIIPFEERA